MNQENPNIFGTVISDTRKPGDGEQTQFVAFRVQKKPEHQETSGRTRLVIALGQSADYFETFFEKGREYGVEPSLRPLTAKVYSDSDPTLEACLENCVIVIDEPQAKHQAKGED